MADLKEISSPDSITTTIALMLYVMFLIMAVILLVNMMIALLSNTYQRIQDNSIYEWSYKKAITVMEYSSYHPVVVPMNLVSLPIYLLYRKCKTDTTKKADETAKPLDDFVRKQLEPRYWAKYGYAYPPTDEDKSNSILTETVGTRHITNKIAEGVFARPLEGIPCGSRDWDTRGIAVEGSRLWYSNDGTTKEHHGAIYHKQCLTADFPKFEVLIQEFGKHCLLSVGLVKRCHKHHIPPGLEVEDTKFGTVGFHVDTGRVFDQEDSSGKEIPGSIAKRGDVIGCKLLFNKRDERGTIPVVFSLNGNDLKIDGYQIKIQDHSDGDGPTFPFICMAYKGTSVLFKLCADEERAPSHPDTMRGRLGKLEELTRHTYQMTNELNANQTRIISQLDFLASKFRNITVETKQEE